jgi:zinc protease
MDDKDDHRVGEKEDAAQKARGRARRPGSRSTRVVRAGRAHPSHAWLWTLLPLLAALPGGDAQALPGPGVSMRDFGFKVGKLDLPSGMRIFIEEDHSQPIVVVVAIVDVGSAQDPMGKEGLAHLVEHLNFRAKPDGKVQRSNLLDFAGAAFWNAYTSHDFTTYVVAGPKEALASILKLEGSRLLRPLAGLDERAFDVERDVVTNELRQRNEQGRITAVDSQLFAALYPEGHPYHRSIGGTEASLRSLSLANAEAFVQEHYIPRNITLYIAGDVDISTLGKMLDATLPPQFLEPPASGPLAPQERLTAEAPPVPEPAPWKGLETVHAPAEAPVLYIAWSLPRGFGAEGHLESFTRQVFDSVSIWAATESSDIAGISTSLDSGKFGTTLICAVRLKEGRQPEKSLERVLDQLIRIWNSSSAGHYAFDPGHANAVLAADRGFARLQLTALVRYAQQAESVAARAEQNALFVHLTGDAGAWAKTVSALAQLSAQKMEAFAFKWLTRDRARAVFVIPSGGPTRSLDSVGRAVAFAPADGVRVKIDPGALKTYVHAPGGEYRNFTLKNGLEVLLARRANSPTVTVTLGFRGGDATGEPLGVAELAAGLASPQKTRNGPASKYGASVTSWTTSDATYVQGRAASGNLENILAILSDRVDSLHVDAALKWYWDEIVSSRRRDETLPSAKEERDFLEAIYPGSPYGRTAVSTSFEKLNSGDVQTWINRTFRPKNAVMAVVGDIEFAQAERQVREWFGDWNGNIDPAAEAPLRRIDPRSGPVPILKVDRPGVAQTEVRLGCSMSPQSPTDFIALQLLGARLRSRVSTLARSTLGGSYGFLGGASLNRQTAHLDIVGNVDDRTLKVVLAVVRKEVDEMDAGTPAEDELSLLRWRLGIASNLRYATNAALAQGLVWMRLAGLPLNFVEQYPALLAAVTPEDVARVGKACKTTAVILLSGDPGVLDGAVKSTAR